MHIFTGIAMAGETASCDEWEEEEQYVFVELQGLLDSEYLKGCTTENSAVLGTDTDQPVVKLNKYVFSGEYEDTIGTAVFFEEIEENGKKKLKYKCHTTRKLQTVRSCLEAKEAPVQPANANSTDEDTPMQT